MGDGDRDARASPARSPSQGLAELAGASLAPMAQVTPEVPLSAAATTTVGAQQTPPRDAVVVPPPLSPPAPPTAVSPTPPAVLERAVAELERLRQDLLGADPRLVAGRLELASGWIRSDASIRAALVQASTACDEEKEATFKANAARDATLGEAVRIRGRCKELEDELQGLRGQLGEETRLRQEQEKEVKAREAALEHQEAKLKKRHNHLGALKKELEATKAELDAKARVLAEDRVAFADMEKDARASLKTLYESGLDCPLAGDGDGPAKLLPFLVKALGDVALGLIPTVEAEAH